MAGLLDYLNLLDPDADALDALDAHIQDPEQAMRKFGLSDDESQAMLSGDKTGVANRLGINPDDLPTMKISQF